MTNSIHKQYSRDTDTQREAGLNQNAILCINTDSPKPIKFTAIRLFIHYVWPSSFRYMFGKFESEPLFSQFGSHLVRIGLSKLYASSITHIVQSSIVLATLGIFHSIRIGSQWSTNLFVIGLISQLTVR